MLSGPANSGPADTSSAPPLYDIARDVLEIGQRQDAVFAVAVEDDQIEAVELFREQLLGREDDQRQFLERCARPASPAGAES